MKSRYSKLIMFPLTLNLPRVWKYHMPAALPNAAFLDSACKYSF